MKDYSRYRKEFPITEKYTFMNHAAISASSARVVKAVEVFLREYSRDGISAYPRWMQRVDRVRSLFAHLIHAAPEEIAFVGNTSEGLSMVASGLKWRSGERVMVPSPEFPANIYPWMNLEDRGVKVTFIEREEGRIDVEAVERALKPGTRLLAISSVDFATGFQCDLEALGDFCRQKGLLFCVDAIQSLGVIPMDVKKNGIHFLSSGGHKWLLSTMGCGGLFISGEVNHMVSPQQVGWKSVRDEEEFFEVRFDLKGDALRFEPGTLNLTGIFSLGSALEMLREVGIGDIRQQVLDLNDLLIEGLKDRNCRIRSSLDEGERSGILSFVPASDPAPFFHFLRKEKISLSLRSDMIRLSPHFYNNREDVERFFKAMDRFQA